MQTAILAVALLTGCGDCQPVTTPERLVPIAAAVEPAMESGTLIFSRGDCLAVKVFSGSSYTHVAIVVENPNGSRDVYDSTNGVGVRKQPLLDYLASQSPAVIQIDHPVRPLTSQETRQLRSHLEEQIGRPYAITHHLTGDSCDGLHCAEYVTESLMAIDLLQARQPARVSPASLREGILVHAVYRTGVSTSLSLPEPPPPAETGFCGRLWIGTKSSCGTCYRKVSGWILCR